jgi:hypothetical protein
MVRPQTYASEADIEEDGLQMHWKGSQPQGIWQLFSKNLRGHKIYGHQGLYHPSASLNLPS